MKFTLLTIAAEYGYANIVKILLEKEARVHEKGYRDMTPLHLASCNRDESVVGVLLEKGANVNEKVWYDMTPLHFAACNGHEKTIEALIQAGANVNAIDEYGKTMLDRANEYIKKVF